MSTYNRKERKERKEHYIAVCMLDEQSREFEQFIDSRTGTYQICGKLEKMKYQPPYDLLAACIGIDNKDRLERMISKKYEIRVIDPDIKE